jgi:hypothetical protein
LADVGKLTQRLSQSAATDDRRAAASQLRNAGFARRHSLEKRGTLGTAAHSHLAEHELAALHAALEDDDPHVVRDAIIAAGDLGDASSVPALLKHLDTDDEEVTLAAIDSLGDIGGLESVEALTQVACDNDADDHARLAARGAQGGN